MVDHKHDCLIILVIGKILREPDTMHSWYWHFVTYLITKSC